MNTLDNLKDEFAPITLSRYDWDQLKLEMKLMVGRIKEAEARIRVLEQQQEAMKEQLGRMRQPLQG